MTAFNAVFAFSKTFGGSVILAAAIVAAVLASPVNAATITGLNPTGVGYSPTTATQDTNWEIVALPAVRDNGGALGDAWIFTGGGGSFNVPGAWLGGGSNAGSSGARWIGAKSNDTSSLITGTFPQGSYYSVIFETTFNSSAAAASIPFSFDIAVDNRATVFVGGTIDTTDPQKPTITGGTQIGSPIWNVGATVLNPDTTPRAFSLLQTASGSAPVVAGTNRVYVVVDDYVSNPAGGPYANIGLLVANPVPEPSTLMLGATAVAAIGGGVMRRRMRKS